MKIIRLLTLVLLTLVLCIAADTARSQVLWLKSDSLSLNNNDPVVTWSDNSGNSNNATQGTSGKRPLYKNTGGPNSMPFIRFDGVDDYLKLTTAFSPSDLTLYIVCAPASAIQTTDQMALLGRENGTNPFGALYFGTGNLTNSNFFFPGAILTAVHLESGDADFYGLSTTASFSGWKIISLRVSGTDVELRVNGSTPSISYAAYGNINSTTRAFSNIDIIGALTGSRAFFAGDVAEVRFYNSALSPASQRTVIDALGTTYGITLPSLTAASVAYEDVAASIGMAFDGDTVIIPAGAASYTQQLVVAKGITLKGQTTTDVVAKTANDQTIILDNLPRSSGNSFIGVSTTEGKSYRLSGITVRKGSVTETVSHGGITVSGNSKSVRVDHVHFDDLRYQNEQLAMYGDMWGVVDHCLFDQPFSGRVIHMIYLDGTTADYGNAPWAGKPYYGSERFIFFEDNCFNNTAGLYGGTIDGGFGFRAVFRYNHSYDVPILPHGTEQGPYRGPRAIEDYNNDYHWATSQSAGGSRAGGRISHDNTHDGVQPGQIPLQTYRMFGAIPFFGASTGKNPWDVNATEANGTHVDGNAPYLFESGTTTAGTGVASEIGTIVDSAKSWTLNQWVGYTATQASGGAMFITGNNSTTLTGNTQNGWTMGTAYEIYKVLISMDQPGRGGGDLVDSSDFFNPINSTTGTPVWTHQALEPCFSWNNIYNPGGIPIGFYAGIANTSILLEGRDYYNNSSRSAMAVIYDTPINGVPYTIDYPYPHPLVSAEPPPSSSKVGGRNVSSGRRIR